MTSQYSCRVIRYRRLGVRLLAGNFRLVESFGKVRGEGRNGSRRGVMGVWEASRRRLLEIITREEASIVEYYRKFPDIIC